MDHEVAWYENLGGGVFGPQHVISTSVVGATAVFAADVDGDTDIDVLAGSSSLGKIVSIIGVSAGAGVLLIVLVKIAMKE